nr:hypothetical protein FFPRI1PSEUD_47330 [Pseudomonas sp. FFPRI_1]
MGEAYLPQAPGRKMAGVEPTGAGTLEKGNGRSGGLGGKRTRNRLFWQGADFITAVYGSCVDVTICHLSLPCWLP